ncbi:MAG: TRAP transporter TatT component family protein, partial [Burkholderiales bacterium]
VEASPDNPQIALAAAQIYSFYASNFVTEPERKKRLAERGLRYARAALCMELDDLCETLKTPFAEFSDEVEEIEDDEQVPLLYGFTVAWATWVQANVDDWNAIADVPKIEALLNKIVALKPRHDRGTPYIYLGVLSSQLPPAMGGKPERAKAYFERALTISGERNLMAQVYYAKQYARMAFDRKLHDQLLEEVLEADPRERGLTLSNTLAQQEARELLAGSKDFF